MTNWKIIRAIRNDSVEKVTSRRFLWTAISIYGMNYINIIDI